MTFDEAIEWVTDYQAVDKFVQKNLDKLIQILNLERVHQLQVTAAVTTKEMGKQIATVNALAIGICVGMELQRESTTTPRVRKTGKRIRRKKQQ